MFFFLLITLLLTPVFFFRDGLYGKCSHNNSCDWVWGAVIGLGSRSAGMGCRSYCHVLVLLCDILHFHTPLCLLPFRGLRHWQEKLYLHGCCSVQPR
jgi:hypothetical protein